eukprot:1153427-Rhodomonas_salina.1
MCIRDRDGGRREGGRLEEGREADLDARGSGSIRGLLVLSESYAPTAGENAMRYANINAFL